MKKTNRLPFGVLLLVCGVTAAMAKGPPRLDPANPDDAVKLHQKLWCSLEEGRPALLWSQGSVYGRRPGEADRKLFNFQIWNSRACKGFQDPVRGYGYRSVSREIMLYLDPETNALVKTWRNPWTDEMVEVVHTQNDPVNMSGIMYARDVNGQATARFEGRFVNGRVIWSNEAPLYYDNPLGGAYQDYVGGHYHAMEMLNVYVYENDLLDPKVKTLPRWSRSWKRVSNFLPWMRMGDRPGQLIFTAVGQRVNSVDDTNEPIRSALKTTFAKYQTPPPLDDQRPNETSWSYFRSIIKPGTPAVVGELPPLIVPPTPTQAANAWEQDLRDNCARQPGDQLTTWWHGRVYSRRLEEKDRHIFDVERLRLSRCELLQDPVRGRGYRRTSREYSIFVDKQTGQPLADWRNPWNGEVFSAQIGRTPEILESVRWERDANGSNARATSRFELTDKTLTGSDATPTFGDDPLGGDYQDYVGGKLQILDFETSERPLAPPKKGEFDQVLSWGQVRGWYPWMKMGSRDGMIIVHAAGVRVTNLEQIPLVLRKVLTQPAFP